MTTVSSDGTQGDPALTEEADLDRSVLAPRRLYTLWESRHWAASAIDFEQDRDDWAELPDDRREELLRGLALFFAGEERVAAAFAPITLSAESEAEAAYLATQQVDEARHALFSERFWREVVAAGDELTPEAAVQDARSRCNDAFTELFDTRLMQAVGRLQAEPSDTDAKVEAVAIYHLVVEGLLALTGLHFMLDYMERRSILPGITEGFHNVKRDEHRHVAYGTWFLQQKARESDEHGTTLQRTLIELLPVAASALVENGDAACDGLDDCEFLDYPSAELNHYALRSLARRLKVIGGATEEIQRFAASGAWRAERVL